MISKLKTVLAIAFSLFLIVSLTYAFTGKSKKIETTNAKFRYTGSSTDYTDLIEPSNWEVADEEDEECPDVGTLPCLVAPDMPAITTPQELVEHIEDLGLVSTTSAEQYVIGKTTDWRN